MKLTDNLVKVIGYDKLLHFLIAGWATQIGTVFDWWIALIIAFVILALNYLKEKYWDSKFDILDLIAAFAGCAIAFIIQWI